MSSQGTDTAWLRGKPEHLTLIEWSEHILVELDRMLPGEGPTLERVEALGKTATRYMDSAEELKAKVKALEATADSYQRTIEQHEQNEEELNEDIRRLNE